jgi:hypothetical protein
MELDYRHVLESLLTLSNDSITLRNKIVFAAILIFLVTLIVYLIQQHYSVSYRDSLKPVDADRNGSSLTAIAATITIYIEFIWQLNESYVYLH